MSRKRTNILTNLHADRWVLNTKIELVFTCIIIIMTNDDERKILTVYTYVYDFIMYTCFGIRLMVVGGILKAFLFIFFCRRNENRVLRMKIQSVFVAWIQV